MFPYDRAIVVLGVEGVQELAKVSDPACHLFPFDICEGVRSPGDVRLIGGDCPV